MTFGWSPEGTEEANHIDKELARHLQKNKGPELEALLVYLMSIKGAGLSGAEWSRVSRLGYKES